jgi:RNase H-like domain found in reverse transcriptase
MRASVISGTKKKSSWVIASIGLACRHSRRKSKPSRIFLFLELSSTVTKSSETIQLLSRTHRNLRLNRPNPLRPRSHLNRNPVIRKSPPNPTKSTRARRKKEYRLCSTNPFPDNAITRSAFERLKTAISSAPVLIHPNFDKPFILYVDASRIGIGCALYQVSDIDNKEHPVLFVSRVLRPAEKNYSAIELECLGVVWSLHKLEHYVDAAPIKLVTDHSALKWIWNLKSTVNSRLFR